jgi:PBSX family phage portal protein
MSAAPDVYFQDEVPQDPGEARLFALSAVRKAVAGMLGGQPELIPSRVIDIDNIIGTLFNELGAVEPDIDPLFLINMVETGNALRPNIDAMVVNVHGGGFALEPKLDLDSEEGAERVRVSMRIAREEEAGGGPAAAVTDEELEARLVDLRWEAVRQRIRAEAFLGNCDIERSFEQIRTDLGTDLESVGYGALEVRRDLAGRPKRLKHIHAWTVRALPYGNDFVDIKVRERVTDLDWTETTERVRFRRYCQIYQGLRTYFKAYGDPRTLSADSGIYYDSPEALQRGEPGGRVATEVLWFSLPSPKSEIYGMVRWSGAMLSVMGSREMEEVNLFFFQRKGIPPLVVMVSGGKLAAKAREELRQAFKDQLTGSTKNFHGVAILEAEPFTSSAVATLGGEPQHNVVRVEFKPLVDAIFKDQLWGQYDKANQTKVAKSFRIPPLLLGETADYNRATADTALLYVDQQVFQPERERFDDTIERSLLRDLGITLWRFESLPPRATDPQLLLDAATKLTSTVMSPDEARTIVSRVLGIELRRVREDWARLPSQFTLAGIRPSEEETAQDSGPPSALRIGVKPEDLNRLLGS